MGNENANGAPRQESAAPDNTIVQGNALDKFNNSIRVFRRQALYFAPEACAAFDEFMRPRVEAESLIIRNGLRGAAARSVERKSWEEAYAIAIACGAGRDYADE